MFITSCINILDVQFSLQTVRYLTSPLIILSHLLRSFSSPLSYHILSLLSYHILSPLSYPILSHLSYHIISPLSYHILSPLSYHILSLLSYPILYHVSSPNLSYITSAIKLSSIQASSQIPRQLTFPLPTSTLLISRILS